jgi:hypothetical protein
MGDLYFKWYNLMLVLRITIFYWVLRATEGETTLRILSPLFIIAGKLVKMSLQRKMTLWVTPQRRKKMFRVQKCTEALLHLF